MSMASMKVQDDDSYPPDNPYGYGLRICLTEDQVEALGLKSNPPAAGSKVGLQAIAIVTTVTQAADPDDDGDGVDVVLQFQITDMEVSTGPRTDMAAQLYT